MTQCKFFITFGNGAYENSAFRIMKEAINLEIFDSSRAYFNSDLEKYTDFWNLHKKLILSGCRGGGYWIWKSFIILEKLKTMNENDILVYCDAGCELKNTGIKRLNDYFEMVNNSDYGILNFELQFLEDRFTKMDTIITLDALNLSKTKQLLSGIVILRKCNHSVKIIEKWYNVNDYHLLDDSPSISPNVDYFVEHRHDQSIYSILCKKYGSVVIKDETYPNEGENWNPEFPIWATRRR